MIYRSCRLHVWSLPALEVYLAEANYRVETLIASPLTFCQALFFFSSTCIPNYDTPVIRVHNVLVKLGQGRRTTRSPPRTNFCLRSDLLIIRTRCAKRANTRRSFQRPSSRSLRHSVTVSRVARGNWWVGRTAHRSAGGRQRNVVRFRHEIKHHQRHADHNWRVRKATGLL
jgi:hypothetical protein